MSKKPDSVVTSVRIPTDLHVKAKELGLSFGAVMRRALMDALTIEAEKDLIRKRIDEYYEKIENLNQRLVDLERVEKRADEEEWNKAMDYFRGSIEETGRVSHNQLLFWAHKLRINDSELLEFIEDKIVGGPVSVI